MKEKLKTAVQHFYKPSGYLPLQQALSQGYDAKVIWSPYKEPKVHRVGGYSEVIREGETMGSISKGDNGLLQWCELNERCKAGVMRWVDSNRGDKRSESFTIKSQSSHYLHANGKQCICACSKCNLNYFCFDNCIHVQFESHVTEFCTINLNQNFSSLDTIEIQW